MKPAITKIFTRSPPELIQNLESNFFKTVKPNSNTGGTQL